MRNIVFGLALSIVSCVTIAQDTALFGDEQQPGNKLHQAILLAVETGNDVETAISTSIEEALTEESIILSPDSKSAMSLNKTLSNEFYEQMLSFNSLIEVTKVLIEEFPESAGQVVALGTYLYPDFAQEAVNGAALTGIISSDDALLIALASGADPAVVTSATAASGAVSAPLSPIGAGIGGGGAGGGDTTASTN